MTPEDKARQQIDEKLTQAGWVIQDMKQLNLGAAIGVAVREYPTDTGPADYVLFVNRNAVGVIEAKKDSAGENLTVDREPDRALRHRQPEMAQRQHATAVSCSRRRARSSALPTTATPPRAHGRFFTSSNPETLATWLAQPETLRRRLAEQMPALPDTKSTRLPDQRRHWTGEIAGA